MANQTFNNPNNVQTRIRLSYEEIFSGVKKEARYQRRETCGACQGSRGYKTCQQCQGKGQVLNEYSTTVDIPAGVEEGMVLNFKRKGHQIIDKKVFSGFLSFLNRSKKENTYGYLVIDIEEEKHPSFSRKSADLITEIPINKSELSSDLSKEIVLLDKSRIKIKIPAGSPDGRILRIAGKGFPMLGNNKMGNLLIVVKVL